MTAAIEAKKKLKRECSSSKTCQEAVEVAAKTLITIDYHAKGAVEFVKTTCASNDDCRNAAEKIIFSIDEKVKQLGDGMEHILPALEKTTHAFFDTLKHAVNEIMPVAANAARGTIESMRQAKDACELNEVCQEASSKVQSAEQYAKRAATETYIALMKKRTEYNSTSDEL